MSGAERQEILSITSFGGFSIAIQNAFGEEIRIEPSDDKRRVKKLWMLIQYLIFRGKEAVPVAELIDMLWPEEGAVGDPLAALRLLIHRARMELDRLGKGMGARLISRVGTAYRWNPLPETRVDTVTFERLYEQSRRANAPERIQLLLEAASLYVGHFLPNAASSQWVMVLDTYYHSVYQAVCEEAVTLLAEFGRAADIVELCSRAIVIDPYVESLHAAFIKALIDTNNHTAAKSHYRYVNEMFMKEMGVHPSEKFAELFRLVAKNTNAMESDLRVIRELLSQGDEDPGSYFAGYEEFKQLYQLKLRECSRSGQALQLALISVTMPYSKKPGPRSQKAFLIRLQEVLRISLRKSDFFTRYSGMQYLVLLQSTSYENGQMVLDRVERNLKGVNRRLGYLLQCTLLPALPG